MYREAVDVFAIGLAKEGLGKDDIDRLNRAFEKAGSEGWLRKFLEILKAVPGARALAVNIAEIHARLGEKDQAFEWLEKAYADHSDGLVRLKEEIGFDNLRSDPRYADLARRIGLPQ
jgi:tetratricopeptide (TPR) repeat protein